MTNLKTLAEKHNAIEVRPGMDGGTVAFIHENEFGDLLYLEDQNDDGDVWVLVELNGGVMFTERYSESSFESGLKFAKSNGVL